MADLVAAINAVDAAFGTGATDHVARMLVRDLATGSDRLDEVVREIAMSRSALES